MRNALKLLAAAALIAAVIAIPADGATPVKANQYSVVWHGATVYPQWSTSPISTGMDGLWNIGGVLRWRKASGQDVGMVRQEGSIASARVAFSANPSNNDTLSIGGKTFTFKSSLGAATTTTQVKILGSAALTLAATLDAINGVTNANVVADTTPFSLSIVADAVPATELSASYIVPSVFDASVAPAVAEAVRTVAERERAGV